MKEAYAVYLALPGDVVIFFCLFLACVARLSRDEHITFLTAVREFIFSMVGGAGFTGLYIAATGVDTRSAWWASILITLFLSLLIEIVTKKANDIRDMSLLDTIKLIFDELMTRLDNFKTKPKTP